MSSTTVGVWRALIDAFADEMYEITGVRMTRLTEPFSPGGVTVTVESTHLFPTVGILALPGGRVTYSGVTATTFTGVAPAADPPLALISAGSVAADASQTMTGRDKLRAGFLLTRSEGEDTDTIGRNHGWFRPAALSDDTYQDVLRVLLFLPAQTLAAFRAVLDVLRPGGYDVWDDAETPCIVYVRMDAIGGGSDFPNGRSFLVGGEAQPRTGTYTVDVADPPTLVYGIYVSTDALRLGTNYAMKPVGAASLVAATPTRLTAPLGSFRSADLNTGIVLTRASADVETWIVDDVLSTTGVNLATRWLVGAEVNAGEPDVVRAQSDAWSAWHVGHTVQVGEASGTRQTATITEFLSARRIRVTPALIPVAATEARVVPAFPTEGGLTFLIGRASVAGSTVTAPVALPPDVLVDYTTVPSAQVVRSSTSEGIGRGMHPFYIYDGTGGAGAFLDEIRDAGAVIDLETR